MLIDWFTVGAQTLNFIILIWLMKRFLYKPILDAIDAREKRIMTQLADADKKKTESQKKQDEFTEKNHKFDDERAVKMAEVGENAKAEFKKRMEDARISADNLLAEREKAFKHEVEAMNDVIMRRAKAEIYSIARKTLADLSDTTLEGQITHVFVQRIKSMDDKLKSEFAAALKSGSEPALVSSAFSLSNENCADIQNAVNVALTGQIPIQFATDPDLIGGIQISSHGLLLAWNIDGYLSTLEKNVFDLVGEKA